MNNSKERRGFPMISNNTADIDEGSGLTADEQAIMDHLVAAWNLYAHLTRGDRHEDDITQFRQAINDCQQIMALRIARREFGGYWI